MLIATISTGQNDVLANNAIVVKADGSGPTLGNGEWKFSLTYRVVEF